VKIVAAGEPVFILSFSQKTLILNIDASVFFRLITDNDTSVFKKLNEY
jgi:hypothetical protein